MARSHLTLILSHSCPHVVSVAIHVRCCSIEILEDCLALATRIDFVVASTIESRVSVERIIISIRMEVLLRLIVLLEVVVQKLV